MAPSDMAQPYSKNSHTLTSLHTRVLCAKGGQSKKSALIIHGIMGSSRNWIGFARSLARQHPHWQFLLVDLRGHGDSHPAHAPNTVDAAARDIAQLFSTSSLAPSVVIGHSFGGKVALALSSLDVPCIREVWSLDSPPSAGAPQSSLDVIEIAKAIRALPMPLETRAEVVDYFLELGFGLPIASWMTTNLRQSDGGYRWHFDIDAIEELMRDYFHLDLWPTLGANPAITYHQVIAANSDRWSQADKNALGSLTCDNVILHTLPDAGHWLHVDNASGLAALLSQTLNRTLP